MFGIMDMYSHGQDINSGALGRGIEAQLIILFMNARVEGTKTSIHVC